MLFRSDEAVPRNIEIARNLQNTQTDMVKQVGKTRREGDYQIGDWVSLDKEPRSGLSKMDAVRHGPFKVVGHCKKRPANYDILYLAIPGSNKSVHTKHLRIWPGIREKVDSGEYCGPRFGWAQAWPKGIGFSQIHSKGAKIPQRGDN